ncbi:MAG: phosphoribosylformylglycinamidine cyclo-ligase [Clostridia bacterium]|nr:phosphoribosylformylglycinamidine cyclo-ligase [Clostridia bacterium]MBR6108345.1 phosphoribosylformylglycinamidine cyclo-ligase [Clostridia bacterium]
MKSSSKSYAEAGVDITAGYEAVNRIKEHVARTKIPGTASELGGFGGAFELMGYKEPVLISGTDGVGTKLKLAFRMNKHDTIGIDCVAMCVNDVVCSGAQPIFFLDYIACGKLLPERIEQIVKGVADGCVESGCALIGGETAEMPGFYPENEYDLAGFSVGVVEKAKLMDNSNVREGDVIIAMPSSGVHSNGFSLVRKIFDVEGDELFEYVPELGMKLGEALLTPTRLYVKPVQALRKACEVHSLAHITGGGFYENIPRAIPKGLTARVYRDKVRVLPIFDIIAKRGNIPERDMFNTFNMGVGMIATVPAAQAEAAIAALKGTGVDAYPVGEVIESDEGVIVC